MRKRNINWGFAPVKPTRADLQKSRREFKMRVREKTKAIRAEYSRLRKSARSGRTNDTRKLEKLFHEVYARNPRVLPEMTTEQLAAIEKLIRGKSMASKKRKSKKKNGKMPAGLKAYWAKKRRAKNSRSKPRKKARRRKTNPKVRYRTRTVTKWRTRTVKVRAKRRRRKSNPRRTAKRIHLKGFTPGQLKRVASAIRRATGKRVRIVKP